MKTSSAETSFLAANGRPRLDNRGVIRTPSCLSYQFDICQFRRLKHDVQGKFFLSNGVEMGVEAVGMDSEEG